MFALVLYRNFVVSVISVRDFYHDTYFTLSRVPETSFIASVPLEEGLRCMIDYEFMRKVQEPTFRRFLLGSYAVNVLLGCLFTIGVDGGELRYVAVVKNVAHPQRSLRNTPKICM